MERFGVPSLSLSTDRCNLSHVAEVFDKNSVEVLMCFSCACKEIAYTGF